MATFVTYYPPHRTGLSLYVQRTMEALAARGHRVTVVTSRFSPDLPLDTVEHGVRVLRLPSLVRISRGQVMPGFPRAAAAVLAEADVANVHTPMLETPLVARLAERASVPLVLTHHGDLVLPTGAANRAIEAIVAAGFQHAARRARRIVAYTEDYRRHSPWLVPVADRVTPVYPPIVAAHPGPGAAAFRRMLGAGEGPLVGYAGRFVEEKRPDLLLRAALQLRRRWPHLRVAFAGQYLMPYERFFDQCAPMVHALGESVRFLGLLEDPQALADFYAACDLLVLPSATECFGLVQAEAMLCGTPVIATTIPGARVPVQVTGMGRLVPPRDATALAGAIQEVLTDPDRYRRTRAEIEAIFQQDQIVDQYETVLREAAG